MPPVTEILSLLIVAAAFAITALGCRLVDVSQINRSTVLAPELGVCPECPQHR
jgi:hypothetical protein